MDQRHRIETGTFSRARKRLRQVNRLRSQSFMYLWRALRATRAHRRDAAWRMSARRWEQADAVMLCADDDDDDDHRNERRGSHWITGRCECRCRKEK